MRVRVRVRVREGVAAARIGEAARGEAGGTWLSESTSDVLASVTWLG